MKHDGKMIFPKVGDIRVLFGRKVPDFLYFHFSASFGLKSAKKGLFFLHFLPKFAQFHVINGQRSDKLKIGDFTSKMHQMFSYMTETHLPSMLHLS